MYIFQINSSKEKGKILTGKIIAIENEQMKEELITCAIIDFNGIRVLNIKVVIFIR